MVMYLKNKGRYKMNYFKGMKYEDIRPIFEKVWDQIQSFALMDSEKDSEKKGSRKKTLARKRVSGKDSEESMKKQKLEDDTEKEDLKAYLDIIPGYDVAADIEFLATKYPIVDWKTHVLTENFMYYQIIRADGGSKNYKIFSEMLDDFDRQDVMDLHRLVEERYATSRPEGYDLMLWGYLKILFQPNEEDEVWRHQHEYNLISWRLFDSCGIHILLMDNGIAIHMMIEKKYPLTQGMLSKMLSRKLEVDHENETAFELLRDGLIGYLQGQKTLGISSRKPLSKGIVRPSKTVNQLEEIHNFKHKGDETLYQAWERYNDLLYKCPTHDLSSQKKAVGFVEERILTKNARLTKKFMELKSLNTTSLEGLFQTMVEAELDLGASVNIMPFSMFKKLNLTNLKETTMLVEMVDMSKRNHRGIVENVLVKCEDQ
ncbi:putative reverse transcriptase domain-containing protein [Tanacetum coccineum]